MSTDQISTLSIHDSTINPNTGRIEGGTVTVHSALVNEVNYVVQLALFGALKTAINAVQLGRNYKQSFAGFATILDNPDLPASNILAQRENTWLVSMRTVGTFVPHRFSIPCADLSLLAANREHMDDSLTAYTDLVDAVIAFVEFDGVGVVVSDILFKGKNL